MVCFPCYCSSDFSQFIIFCWYIKKFFASFHSFKSILVSKPGLFVSCYFSSLNLEIVFLFSGQRGDEMDALHRIHIPQRVKIMEDDKNTSSSAKKSKAQNYSSRLIVEKSHFGSHWFGTRFGPEVFYCRFCLVPKILSQRPITARYFHELYVRDQEMASSQHVSAQLSKLRFPNQTKSNLINGRNLLVNKKYLLVNGTKPVSFL